MKADRFDIVMGISIGIPMAISVLCLIWLFTGVEVNERIDATGVTDKTCEVDSCYITVSRGDQYKTNKSVYDNLKVGDICEFDVTKPSVVTGDYLIIEAVCFTDTKVFN